VKADPLASAPAGIKPEWYFLTLYETLKLFPSQFLELSSETLVNIVVMIVTITMLMIPFLDRKASQGEPSPVFTWVGIVAILYIGISISLAYLT